MNLEIKIEEPLKGPLSKPIFFGKKTRIPSHTDVAFLSKNRYVIAHRFAGKLFLVEKNGNSFQILDSYKIKFNGKYEFPDLIHAYKNRIYIVNFNNILHIVDVKHDKLVYNKSFVLHPTYGYHGVYAFSNKVYLASTTKKDENPFVITEYDVERSMCLHYPVIGNEHRMKDISFINQTSCIIITSYNDRDVGLGKEKEVYDGEILYCQFQNSSFHILDKINFSCCHFDSVITKENLVYITATFEETGSYILMAEIKENKITNLQKYPCEAFPHGIDVFEDQIGYSCYGTSSTYIKQLPFTE
jgi:hypothetical protein